MEFEKAYQRLNEAQRAAVDHIEGPLLVIAGPGTGKTQLLSIRVANILRLTDASPENILCLTFTESGASNMRQRLADFIGPEAYKVQIHTYHSFGAYILQENRPDLSQAVDELEKFNIIRDIQSKLHPTDILRPDYLTKDIISTISLLKQAKLTPDDVRKIVKRNQIDNGLIFSAIEEHINNTKLHRYPANKPDYEQILAALASFVENAPEKIHSRVEPLARIYYRSLAEIFLKDDGETSIAKDLSAWRSKYFEKDRYDHFVFKDEVANKKLLSLADIMEQYINQLDAVGMFDFDDMILKAIKMLEEDDDKRFNAQERFQYILLDEFQDTNEAQAHLVSVLTDNPNIERPNIMAVGDDDQAIYGFQGASTSNFYDFDEHYHPEHILLNKNYRSSKPILDFAHNVVEQCEDRFCKAPNVNIDKNISAENPPASTSIELREYAAAAEEYSFVASKIQDLIENQGVSGKRIAIISPKHKYLVSIVPYLHRLNIPIAYEKQENILDSTEVIEVLNFADLLIGLNKSPRDADPYFFELLSQSAWGLAPKTIIELLQAARSNRRSIVEEMQNSSEQSLQDIANYCVGLAAKIDSYSADYIINEICAKLYGNMDQLDYGAFELFSNLNTLRDLARNKNRGEHKLYLRDLRELVNAYQNAEVQIPNRSPYHESDNAVRMMSAHSSKGLEFDYVFLIAADNKHWSDAKGNTDRFTLPRNLEHVRHTGDSNDEKIRLFFVAITRAKAHLFLTYSRANFAGQKSDPLKYLDLREADDHLIYSHIIPEPYNRLLASQTNAIMADDIAPSTWFDNYIPDDGTKRALLLPQVEHYHLSPTHLNTFINIDYGGPIEFLRNYIIHSPSPSDAALTYGTHIHAVMDEINKEKIDNATALERFAAKVSNIDASAEEKEQLRARGEKELRTFLEARGDALRNTEAKSEYGFPGENLVLGNAQLCGKIDRIEINEAEKTITVADFKTGHPKERWSNSDTTFNYKIQLYFYKLLIENSRAFQGYRVTKGRIDYIAADNYGNIRPLELDFDEAESTRIATLIQAVFSYIKKLDFPDISEFKNTKAFADWIIENANA